MKRTLSLVLALVMVLGSFTTVFAAEAVDTAAEFLAEEGVLLGDAEGDLMLEDNLERRDAVVLLSRLLGAEDVAAEFTVTEESPTWEDARTDAYYLPLFAWAEVNGYFEGNDDGTFAPRNSITAPEFSLVLLRALGYEVNGHEAWAASLEQAEDLGLLEGVEVEFEDLVVRGEMAVMIFNALGTEMNDSTITLAEFLEIEMPVEEVTELEVEDVYAENLMEVEVVLSSADLASGNLEEASNYRIAGFIVEEAELNDDVVTLLLNDNLNNNRSYELLVRGLDRELNGRYDFDVRDNAAPYVVEVEALGEYGIKVTTNEPIEDPAERNFLLDGVNVAMIVEQYGRDIILTPYHNRAFDEGETVLTVGRLTDYAGFRSVSEDFDIEIVEDEEAPEAIAAESRGNVVTVEFDKDVYEKSVKKGNAFFEVGRNEIESNKATKVDTNKVAYEFNSISRRADFVVKGVQNHSKVAMEETVVDIVEIKDNLEPEVIDYEVYFTGETTAIVELTFDKVLDEDQDGSYNLYDDGEVHKDNLVVEDKAIKLDKDTDIVSINLTGLKADEDYVLEVENLEDLAGNEMYVYYVDFTMTEADEDFEVVNILTHWDNEEIEIRFNNPVDRFVAEIGSNYVFDLKNGRTVDLLDVEGRAIVDRNGERVTLEVPGLNDNEYLSLTISSTLKDIDGNRIISEIDGDNVLVFDLDGVFEGLTKRAEAAKLEAAKYEGLEGLQAAIDAVDAADDNGEKLEEAVEALEELMEDALEDAIEAAEEAIEKLPEEITLANKDAVVAARNLVDKVLVELDEDAKIDGIKDLEAAEAKIEELEDGIADGDLEAARKDLQAVIDEAKNLLEEAEEYNTAELEQVIAVAEVAKTSADITVVEDAKEALETAISNLQAVIADNNAAEEVETAITSLPATNEFKYSDRVEFYSVEYAHFMLTDNQKALISEEANVKLAALKGLADDWEEGIVVTVENVTLNQVEKTLTFTYNGDVAALDLSRVLVATNDSSIVVEGAYEINDATATITLTNTGAISDLIDGESAWVHFGGGSLLNANEVPAKAIDVALTVETE